MSIEDEFELNYVKIDSESEIKLIETEEYATEISILFSKVMDFEQYKISKKIMKEIEKYIPDNTELLKYNIDFAKKYIKIINADKRKNFNSSVKRLLSIDFKNEFIFNYTNIFDVCSIISLLFSECKKYKIASMDDLKKNIKKINFQRYDFYRIFLDYARKKKRNSVSMMNKSSIFNSNKKELYVSDDIAKENNNKILVNNIKSNYILNNENNYSKEEDHAKILSRNTFIYPEYNKIGDKDPLINKNELPIEIIMLLSKFKEVKCLIFQIQNIEKEYINLATFILSNIDWLFIKGIDEIKLDICNEDIQQRLDKAYEKLTEDLYIKNNIDKSHFYFIGNYSVRSMNCWIPESDIFFEEKKRKKHDYTYKTQITEDSVIIDDYICNIYNVFGNLMNIRYIPKFNFSNKNNFNKTIIGQNPTSRSLTKRFDDFNKNNNLDLNNNNSIECLNESISIFDLDIKEKGKSPKKSINKINENNNQMINDNEIPFSMMNITEKYNDYFKMILIYCNYLNKNLNNIKILNLFFQNSFSYEISIGYQINYNIEYTHFLIFLNQIDTLKELNCSFNSLDDQSFEYILGIIYKNSSLSKIRMSFFTPDINYYDNTLFNLCSSMKLNLTQLFTEFSDYQKRKDKNKEQKINEYILNEKLLDSFVINLSILSNLFKIQTLKYLEELIFRFDIPLPLINNQKYKNVLIKFIINIFIMISFQQNQIKTFKILAPNLELNCNKMPFIRSFFNEISLREEENRDKKDEVNNNVQIEIKSEEKTDEIKKEKEINEQENNRENEHIQKNEKKEILRKISENEPEIYSQISQENNKEYEIITEKKLDNYDNSNGYNKTMISTNSSEKAAIRNNSTENNDDNNYESRKLNPNEYLENLVLQLKISYLPEIFNFCKINNLAGLKYINLGNLDEVTFRGFVNDYKLNCKKLKSLLTLKINLGFSVLSFDDLENYIYEFININSPKLKEKLLLTNLKINNEEKMKELIELVYLKANIENLVVKINFENIDLFSKLFSNFIIEYKNKHMGNINSLLMILNLPKYKKINNMEISKHLFDFIIFSKNRSILCNEYS